MQERLDQQPRYNFRRNGYIDVHAGPLKNTTFHSLPEAIGSLSTAENMSNKISSGLKVLSIPILVFSSLEAGLGLKEKRTSRVLRGVAGIGIGLGSRLSANLFDKMADTYSLEKDNIEDAFFSQPQAA